MSNDWRHYDTAVSHFVPSTTERGLSLHVRSHATDTRKPPVLFIHGATLASRLMDIPRPGASWLKACDAAGFAAYAMDVRGYGRSHSRVMAGASDPYGPAAEVVHDIDDVVTWLCQRHRVTALQIVGGSWGTVTGSTYASGLGKARVKALVLYAPIYAERNEGWITMLADPQDCARFNPDLGAARQVDLPQFRARWDEEIRETMGWRDEAVFDALLAATLSDDEEAGCPGHASFAAPNGTLLDLWQCFTGTPVYEPKDIHCPSLLIRGSADTTSTRSDALALFDRLSSQVKRYVEIANGSHFATAEMAAPQIFAETNSFLRETSG